MCYSSPTTVVCVSCFRFSCSYLVLSAYDPRPPLLYTYTQQRILIPSVNSSLSREALLGVTRMNPSPSSPSGTYLSVTCFSTAYLFDTCSCDIIYLRREVFTRGDWYWGTRNKTSTDISLQSNFIVAKTESVLEGGTCEYMPMDDSVTLQCRPDIISMQTSPTLFTALLSCPG